MAPAGTKFMLNTGAEIPAIGLGIWEDKAAQENAVTEALKAGYRYIDSAQVYNSERAVGRAIKKSGIPREELFISTKLWNNDHNPEDVELALDKSLKDLGLDYVDLFLMHWPCPFAPGKARLPMDENGRIRAGTADFVDTYKAMEVTMNCGKAKAIGISNFSRKELERVLDECTIVPAVHRVELHPWLQQPDFVGFHKTKGIHISQYSPFGCQTDVYEKGKSLGKLTEDPRVIWIAEKHDKAVTQVVLAWGIAYGHSVLPKSFTASRIKSNLEGDFKLDDDDILLLRFMDEKIRLNDPSARYGWDFFVGDDGKDQMGSRPASASASLSRAPSLDKLLTLGRALSFSRALPSSRTTSPSRESSPGRALSPDREGRTISSGGDVMDTT